jgi:hypothetical protein
VSSLSDPVVPSNRYLGWDLVVGVLAILLAAFLIITMGVRSKEEALVERCHDRLMAISQAQQSYLVAKGKYAENFIELLPYMDQEHRRMPFLCPITGRKFEMLVQQERYIVLAPYTSYSVNTGDASW